MAVGDRVKAREPTEGAVKITCREGGSPIAWPPDGTTAFAVAGKARRPQVALAHRAGSLHLRLFMGYPFGIGTTVFMPKKNPWC